MKTFRELDVYPRILLIVMLVMLLVFSVAYPLTISSIGGKSLCRRSRKTKRFIQDV